MNLYILLFNIFNKFGFMFSNESQSFTFIFWSGCSSNSMYISLNILRNIKLNDPINFREIKTSRGNISTDENTILLFTKSEINSHSFFLFLMSLKLIERTTELKLSKGLIDKSNLLASRRKNQDFLFMMCLQKRI